MKKGTVVAIALYIGAIVLANWLVTRYGQPALLLTAFVLIPFDLIIRDLMQDRWQGTRLKLRMATLILAGALVSLITATGSLRVNCASVVAFLVAGTLDALTYQWMIRYGRIFRINCATTMAAVTDSLLFALIAFDHWTWKLVLAQTLIKIAGGFVWSLVMYRFFKKRAVEDPKPVATWVRPGVIDRRFDFSRRPGYSLSDYDGNGDE